MNFICLCVCFFLSLERFCDEELVERLISLQDRMYRKEITFLRRKLKHVMSRIDRIEQNQEKMMRNQERIIRNQESQNLEMTAPIVAGKNSI